MMPLQRELRGAHRNIAVLLALVWLAGGASGVLIGVVQQRFGLLIVGVLAIGYGLLWSQAVRRGRLLTWTSLGALRRRR